MPRRSRWHCSRPAARRAARRPRSLLDALAGGDGRRPPQEAREQIVHGFADSSPEALAGDHTLRGLALTLFYALPDLGTGRNPNWDAIGYPGPDRSAARPRAPRFGDRRRRGDDARGRRLRGRVGPAGGGVIAAGELAAAGKSVVVLEMGGYYDDRDFNGSSSPPTRAST